VVRASYRAARSATIGPREGLRSGYSSLIASHVYADWQRCQLHAYRLVWDPWQICPAVQRVDAAENCR